MRNAVTEESPPRRANRLAVEACDESAVVRARETAHVLVEGRIGAPVGVAPHVGGIPVGGDDEHALEEGQVCCGRGADVEHPSTVRPNSCIRAGGG
jgi:hypothetical protein